MYYYVYVLRYTSRISGKKKFYVGSTENLKGRFLAHKQKSVRTTKVFSEIELVYYEACLNKADSMKRELQLKTGFGRGYLKRRIGSFLEEK